MRRLWTRRLYPNGAVPLRRAKATLPAGDRAPAFRRLRSLLAHALALSVVAFAVTAATPDSALAQQGKKGGQKRNAKGAARPSAAAKPAPTSPSRPLPVYKPKRVANQTIRYEIVEGLGKPETVVVIGGDGAVRYKHGDRVRTFRLKKTQLKALSKEIKKASFRTLDSIYGDHALTPDPKSKTVVLKFGSHTESVQDFLDPEHPAPLGFRSLTDTFDKLVKRLEKVPTSKIPFSGVGITAQTDRTVYPSAAGGAAPVMWAALAINNSGDSPLRMDFSTAQKYDFAIRDSAGNEVYRWSKGRQFDAKESRVAVHKGGVHYVEEIRLVEPSGSPLPPGDYTLDWRLTGSMPSAGQVPFQIAEPETPEATAPAETLTAPAQKGKPQKGQGAKPNNARRKRQNG